MSKITEFISWRQCWIVEEHSQISSTLRLNVLWEFSARKIPMSFFSGTISFQGCHISYMNTIKQVLSNEGWMNKVIVELWCYR